MYSPDWIKNKKATINAINKEDNKDFQHSVRVALNYEEIKKDPQRITKIKPFINKYNWERINSPSEKDDWKKFEENNVTITLNVLHAKKEKIYPAYVSKHNSSREKQVIFLTILNGEKREAKSEGQQRWHYFAVKKLLLRKLRVLRELLLSIIKRNNF